jgi:cytidine deaminase
VTSLPPEDNKLVVLAKATRARTGATEGAALRDLDGRTYAGATVELPSLQVSAMGVVIAMAVASGAKGAEAAVVLTEGDVSPADLDALRDFAGDGVTVRRGTPAGSVQETLST